MVLFLCCYSWFNLSKCARERWVNPYQVYVFPSMYSAVFCCNRHISRSSRQSCTIIPYDPHLCVAPSLSVEGTEEYDRIWLSCVTYHSWLLKRAMTLPGPDLIRGVLNTDWTVPREGDAEGGGGGGQLESFCCWLWRWRGATRKTVSQCITA